MKNKYLICGLGNPGQSYSKNYHNAGFMFIDYLINFMGEKSEWKNKFNGEFLTIENEDKVFYIAKPQTFMNLSGTFVSQFANYHNIDKKNILIFYDDINFELGTFRYRESGSSGGQNGIKNIIENVGTESIKRFKIGIGKKDNITVKDHVLQNMSKLEIEKIKVSFENIAKILVNFFNSKNDEFIL